jgi:hypothetical protein
MQIPEPGFYYHYKHDPQKDFNNYTYGVIGIALHSEDKSYLVMYRPLYNAEWLPPAQCSVRPLEMFFEEVEYQGKTLLRFTKITDQGIIEKLTEIKNQLY